MRKKFLFTIATAVATLLVGTMVAQAASIQWGGRLTPRFEVNDRSDFNNETSSNYFVEQRIRLQAKVDILPDTSAFIQMQSVQTWGEADGTGGALGGGNSSFTANDLDASVGIHQAYFVLKNFAGLPVDMKMGRQEVVLDGHRLFGNTIWTMGMQSHDGVRLNHHQGNHTISAMYLRANEGAGTPGAAGLTDADDIDVYVAWANFQGILGGGLSLYAVAFDDECDANAAGVCTVGPTDNNMYTIGGRQAGQMFGLDYRGEFYYQFGGAEAAAASVAGNSYATTGAGSGIDRRAYMFGIRIGKKFNNVMWKPSLTLWYDYLSGTSEEDARNGKFKTFNTLFDTGHKFYGLMDMFLPAGGANTNYLGLVDYAIKATLSPAKNWKFKAAVHQFYTAESPNVNAGIGAQNANRFGDGNLGQEIDLALIHKYNANTTISLGLARYLATPLFHVVARGAGTGGAGNDNADWAYLQFDIRF